MESLQQLYDRFDPKKLQVEPGFYDFTLAFGYNEELVRHNLNSVVRPNTAHIVAPSLIKQVVKKEKPNFVKMNKQGLGEVSAINKRRVEQMGKPADSLQRTNTIQSFCRKSDQTRSSTEPSIMMSSPKGKSMISKSMRRLQTQ